jgi:hypothetical protein
MSSQNKSNSSYTKKFPTNPSMGVSPSTKVSTSPLPTSTLDSPQPFPMAISIARLVSVKAWSRVYRNV